MTADDVRGIHTPEVVAEARRFAEAGGGWLESDTFVCPASFDVALAAAGAVDHTWTKQVHVLWSWSERTARMQQTESTGTKKKAMM